MGPGPGSDRAGSAAQSREERVDVTDEFVGALSSAAKWQPSSKRPQRAMLELSRSASIRIVSKLCANTATPVGAVLIHGSASARAFSR